MLDPHDLFWTATRMSVELSICHAAATHTPFTAAMHRLCTGQAMQDGMNRIQFVLP